MQIWSNTKTLDGYIPELSFVTDKTTAEVALVGGKAINLDEFPNLRGIFKTGVGRDNVPEEQAKQRGIVCAFPSAETSEVIYEETADFACNLIFKCLYSEVGDFASWKKIDRPVLKSRLLLVIGTGKIGKKVATKMGSFLRVSTYDALTNSPEELESLVRTADCISLHIPLLPETRNFFDATKLSWMKAGASLVNTARGPVVNEEALYNELVSGRIRAAFDVFWEEPYKGKLTQLPSDRFLASPHIASTCREFLAATSEDFRSFLRELKRS